MQPPFFRAFVKFFLNFELLYFFTIVKFALLCYTIINIKLIIG